jgi:phosphate transport system protein
MAPPPTTNGGGFGGGGGGGGGASGGGAKAHTSREFDRELRTLRERLLAMGGRAERQISRAVESLSTRDDAIAAQVIAEDARIDQDEVEIDELAFLILARRQPVASDLRFVMLAMKIVTDLERIGDLAVNIAKRERELLRYAPSTAQPRLEALAEKVLAALRGALDAFVNADAERAEKVIAGDKEIDALNTHFIADVLSAGADNVAGVARSLALSSVSRYLERIGDHATNIAEMVIYFVRGRDVRHHLPTRRP